MKDEMKPGPGCRHSSAVSRHALITMLAFMGMVMLAGCDNLPVGYATVKEIVTSPGQFEGKEVKLKGKVHSILKLGSIKSFMLQDESGERIMIVTGGQLPAENSEVVLKGKVASALIVGGAAVGQRVEETKRLR